MPDNSLSHITGSTWLSTIDANVALLLLACLVLGVVIGWSIAAARKNVDITTLKTALDAERQMNQERHAILKQTFTALSAEALHRNNASFLQLAQQTLSRFQVQAKGELELKERAVAELVKPIQETLSRTEKQLRELERERRESHGALTRHLENLARTQQALHSETRNLVQALRRPEVRGQWGELTLRRLAELAGMVEHCDFVEQVHTTGSDGALRPDMVVHMPGGREVVVDVKTPLDAYLSAVEATDDRERDQFLQQHARLVRERVRTLAGKRYWDQFDQAPDFVILFIPGDQFLAAALDVDRALLEDALSQKVVLATPTSLVALLRAVAYGWRQETLTRNADRIRALGEEMYSRLATLSQHLAGLGRNLDASVTQFNRVVGSFESKVMPSARKFTDLGINAKKDVVDTRQIETGAREVGDTE